MTEYYKVIGPEARTATTSTAGAYLEETCIVSITDLCKFVELTEEPAAKRQEVRHLGFQ